MPACKTETPVMSGRFEHRVVIDSDYKQADDIRETIVAQAKCFGFDGHDLYQIKLALAEAITNAIEHGNKRQAAKHVNVHYSITSEELHLQIEDEGPGFDASAIPDPRLPEYIDRPSGRGIFLMRHCMDELVVSGNRIEMWKFRSVPKEDKEQPEQRKPVAKQRPEFELVW